MRFPFHLRYLHEKPLPRLPLWNPGNPRPRLFMPLYWLKMVQHRNELPKDTVKFECHWQMSGSDVKEYLEKLYKVQVADIRIEIEKGTYMKHPKIPGRLSPPSNELKFAYVQLKDQEFTFPNIFEKKKSTSMDKEIKVLQNMQNRQKNKELPRLDIGTWF